MKQKTLAFGVIFATILLPVMIILFLNLFGENKYELPILKPADASCDGFMIFNNEAQSFPGSINLIIWNDSLPLTDFENLLARINSNFENDSILIMINDQPYFPDKQFQNLMIRKFMDEDLNDCIFTIEGAEGGVSHLVVLVDINQKVRGIYQWQELSEQDRLMVEIKILQTIYQDQLL